MRFEEIDWAMKRFGLNYATNKDEIKKTYYRLASYFHPDKNPNLPNIEREFDDVTKAYKILIDYCLSCERSGQGLGYSFNKEEFNKNLILVKIRE
jgi:hypothetical protein